jgi:hypothetical protein
MMWVGDKVLILESIYEDSDDCHPGGYLAHCGEVLIIRDVCKPGDYYCCYVSHENVLDQSFGVHEHEIDRVLL